MDLFEQASRHRYPVWGKHEGLVLVCNDVRSNRRRVMGVLLCNISVTNFCEIIANNQLEKKTSKNFAAQRVGNTVA